MFAYACAAALALVSIARWAEGGVAVGIADGDREIVGRPHDPAVEAAARGFRLQVYNTYRLDREEFERRRAAGEQVQARWREAGSRPDAQQALIRWLHEATEQSRPEVRGALPETPEFGRSQGRVEVHEQSGPLAARGDPEPPLRPAPAPASNPGPSGSATPRRLAIAKPARAPPAQDVRDWPARPAQTIDSHPSSAVNFNVGELMARASGYSVGLRTVDSALHEEEDFSPSQLAALLIELETLLNQRHDLLLYEQLVSAEDRERLLRSLPFPQATVAGLGSRIARVRERLVARAGSDSAERARQLQTLEELSLRLSRVHRE